MEHPKTILERHDIDPKKSLGQNFLSDNNILRQIVALGDVTADDEVLEIGPGLGSMTAHLAEVAKRVVAVELDDRLLPILRRRIGDHPAVEVVHGDVLELNPADWFAPDVNYKVVANVPYYITGAIFEHVLSHPRKPQRVVMTVQKDVAERITAGPPDMSILAVSVQFYGRAVQEMNLSAGSFWPRPRVASSVLTVDLTDPPVDRSAVTDEKLFFRIVKAAFSQKRKQIHNNLRQLGLGKKGSKATLQAAGIEPRRRAQTLDLPEWVALYTAVSDALANGR